MILSIIIPVYNIEFEIFCRCINSIKKLNNIDYEIIIIDDGSKEEYSIIYKEYIEQLRIDHIRLYKKENGGVSSARNLGIELCNGQYIMFVDADDEVEISLIDEKIFKLNYDYIIFDGVCINEKGNCRIRRELNLIEGKIDYIELLKQFLIYDRCHTPWGKVIKKDLIMKKNFRFDERMMQGEDALFNLNIILEKPQILYVKKIFYKYYNFKTNLNSRWKKNPQKMFENYISLYRKKYEICNLYLSDKEESFRFMENYIKNIFRTYKKMEKFSSGDNEYVNLIKNEISKVKITGTKLHIIYRLKLIFMKYNFMWIFKFI